MKFRYALTVIDQDHGEIDIPDSDLAGVPEKHIADIVIAEIRERVEIDVTLNPAVDPLTEALAKLRAGDEVHTSPCVVAGKHNGEDVFLSNGARLGTIFFNLDQGHWCAYNAQKWFHKLQTRDAAIDKLKTAAMRQVEARS